ncbi:hypothetical protein LVD15_08355 [Fulvivirga maritima]|uniref:hypothetical protein n=1 Tax=Fulvivirga maritima TaxID=2904247 RepID=UPI001F3A273F|nr:hypothetical protein [Fulvivirga maritima]UII28428.1 hypothetical protein LVD15_08355 [Fulvivirga maritima]
MNKYLTYLSTVFIILCSCSPSSEPLSENPAADGFNLAESDKKAIALADSVMLAMGGRKNYDEIRYLSWNFFGKRDLVWDKHANRVRIDFPAKETTYLLYINSGEGKVQQAGKEITQPDSLKKYLQEAKSIWINDSYWLVMPFKLKDSGVTLKYKGEEKLPSGQPAYVITLTFDQVGDTPNNKYEIYIDQSDHLVKQWAYFKEASQDSASAVWPFDNYEEHNGVLFSSDRSDGKGPRDLKVYNELPEEVFKSFKKPSFK